MSQLLATLVENLGRPRVLVLGDLILDRYVWGDAERISQEAPVILLRADRREERLGGAASVSSMLAALEAEVTLAGVVGADDAGKRTRELLRAAGIDDSLTLDDPSRPTTLKERYLGRAQQRHAQQMMRVDYEVRDHLEEDLQSRLAAAIESRLGDFDIILVSDYDKGVCVPELVRRLIGSARDRRVRLIVDPIRGGDYSIRYRGSAAMTPNRLEAGLAAGRRIVTIDDAFEAAEILKRTLDMEVGLITLDRDGMVLVDREGKRRHFPVRQREVYDITGAGDMVLAVLGMALAAGIDYPEAIQIANAAGGLEVERVGVATLTRGEIVTDILHAAGTGRSKVVEREDLVREVQTLKGRGRSVVFTNGCFDILHAGHVAYLREARAQGDALVVGLNTDASVRRLGKGTDRPVNELALRAEVLGALECVDFVCPFDEDTPLALIEAIVPDVLVKGSDYRPEQVVGREFVESRGGRLHLAGFLPGLSTTRTIERMRRAA
jgi:D-beta-D-heptose 7-phosphate kinase/D-beta-D-heptose 1-phosphate adenosyltransferase